MPTLKQGAITTTVVITAMRCPMCGVHYGLDEDFRQRALEDSKRGWYCTNGHSLVFTESEADRERKAREEAERRLEAERGWSQQLSDSLAASERTLSATKGQVTKLRNRAKNGVCAFCHRHFENVERHMKSKHAAETVEV